MKKRDRDRMVLRALLLTASLASLPLAGVQAQAAKDVEVKEPADIVVTGEEAARADARKSEVASADILNPEAAGELEDPDVDGETGEAETQGAARHASDSVEATEETGDIVVDIVVDPTTGALQDPKKGEGTSDVIVDQAGNGESDQALEEEAVLSARRQIVPPAGAISAKRHQDGFFYDGNNTLVKNHWVEYAGKYYFPDGSGKAYAQSFITFGPKISYYMDQEGRRFHGVLNLGEKKYLLDEWTGILHKDNAWVDQTSGRYFPNEKGELYYSRYIYFGSDAHYMDAQGRQHRGVSEVDGKLYLFDDQAKLGKMRKDNAWVQYRGKFYFPNAQGVLYRNQFITFGSKAYYMGADGSRQYGLVHVGSTPYYMEETTGLSLGKLVPGLNIKNGKRLYYNARTKRLENSPSSQTDQKPTSGVVEQGGDYYFLGADGQPKAGIFQTGDSLFFYDPSQAKRRRTVEGRMTWQGKDYYVKAGGELAQNEIVVLNKRGYRADNLGILSATNGNLVLDLSYYQDGDDINYDLLSRGISGVILRAGFTGYGTGSSYYKDTAFDRHYAEFTKRGIPVGAYWYSCADTPEEGKAEAEFMLKVLKGKYFHLPIYWDTEDQYHQAKADKKTLTDTAKAFLSTMEANRYYVGLYGSSHWLKNRLDMRALRDYDVWVAHYGVAQPSFSGDYGMWQFTSSFRLPGYGGKLDANLSYRNYPKIIKGAGLNQVR